MKTINKIKTILILVIISAFMSSCSDFLDMTPSNSIDASGTTISTVTDAQMVMSGIMSNLVSPNLYGRNFLLYADAKGGDLTIYQAGRGLDNLYSFNHSATSGTYSGFWSVGYNTIMQINNLLQNIDSLEKTGTTDFNYVKGQALTLRGMLYFDLVRLYGEPYNYDKTSYGVPLVLTPLSSSAQESRATVEKVYSQIITDLSDGKTLLSGDKSLQDGYIGYYANVAIDARVKLYMDNYDGALADALEIINSGKYTLYTNNNWVDSWKSQYGSESILELYVGSSESDLGTSSLGVYYMQYKKVSGVTSGYFLASDYFLARLGEDATDVRWGIMGNDEYWYRKKISRKGACYKYLGSTSLSGDGRDKSTYTAVNIKLIRLSEVYLIASEAELNRTTSKPDSAAYYLNQIRQRSPLLAPATAATITNDMILDERSKELFGEGQRFFDMIRMNKSITYNDDFQNVPISTRDKTIDRTFGKIILPIPQSEINANSAIADEQNEAYK